MRDEDPNEIPPCRGPAEGERESDDSRRRLLVGGVAVDDRGGDPAGKVRKGNLGGAGGIDHVDDRLKGEEDPEPPPVGVCLAPIGRPLRVSVHIVAPLTVLGERGGAASFHDLVVEGGGRGPRRT